MLRIPHLLVKGGGIPDLGRQIMKVLGSEGVSMKEFFDNISKSNEIFLFTPLEVKGPTTYQDEIGSPNHKEWMDAIRDEMDSMTRKKV